MASKQFVVDNKQHFIRTMSTGRAVMYPSKPLSELCLPGARGENVRGQHNLSAMNETVYLNIFIIHEYMYNIYSITLYMNIVRLWPRLLCSFLQCLPVFFIIENLWFVGYNHSVLYQPLSKLSICQVSAKCPTKKHIMKRCGRKIDE